MKQTLAKMIGMVGIVVLAGLLFAPPSAFGQVISEKEASEIMKQSSLNGDYETGSRAVEGAWTSTVTVRACSTGAAIRTFPMLSTFARGGTLQAFSVGAAPLPQSPGYGVWTHLSDRRFYSVVIFFRFNADGTPSGSLRLRRYLEVDILERNFTARFTGENFDNNGNLLGSGCASEVGTRIDH